MQYVKVVLLLFLISAELQNVCSLFKITNILCESFNESWVKVRQCRLRAVKRNIAVLNLNVDVLHPTYQIKLSGAVLKKANGYKIFPMNFTIDACAYMRKVNNPIANIIYTQFKGYTNINHTCPYVGELIVKDFYPKHELFHLPLPNGEYALWLTFYYHSQKVIDVKSYFSFSNE